MNRQRVPRQHRRYSLPATSSLAPFGCRTVPEGSDTFQKALEELYTSEPNHAPSRNGGNVGFGLNGLNNIVEGNESDYTESEDDSNESSNKNDDVIKISRRHSSPSCLSKDEIDGHFKDDASVRKLHNSLMKSHHQYRREYFIKHGHWPSVNKNKQSAVRNSPRPKSFYDRPNKSQDVAFGTSSPSLTSTMAKLRV